MEGDFNVKGKQYSFIAKGEDRPDFEALRPKAFNLFFTLQNTVSQGYSQVDESQKKFLNDVFACSQRLAAFLYHSNRFSTHVKSLHALAPRPGELVFHSIDEVCIDFESFLFLARATLDRLSFFVACRVYNQPNSDKFSKLKNVLENFIKKDERATKAIEIINESLPVLSGLIVDSPDTQALRSALIHRRSIGEITSVGFTVHGLPDGRLLYFDCELQNRPVIGSAEKLFKYVVYVNLNLLGIYAGLSGSVSLNDCSPSWTHNIVHYTQLIDQTERGPRFSIVKAFPDGIKILTHHLKPEVFEFAVERQLTKG